MQCYPPAPQRKRQVVEEDYKTMMTKLASRFSCSVCKHDTTKVIMTTTMPTGPIVRRRECAQCKNRWYTNQDPEYRIPSSKVKYVNRQLHYIEDSYEADEEAAAAQKDAARYRWLREQTALTLKTNGADVHSLAVNITRFSGIKQFDDLIDQAMKMYPSNTVLKDG